MTAKPLDWKSWWSARLKMSELWDGSLWSGWRGDEALVAALRRGNVRYKHRGCASFYPGESVPIKDALAGLRKLTIYRDEAAAECEVINTATTISGGGGLWVARPLTRKTVMDVRIRCPELVWPDLYDDIIQFELPAGIDPDTEQKKQQFLKWMEGEKEARGSYPTLQPSQSYPLSVRAYASQNGINRETAEDWARELGCGQGRGRRRKNK